jgi:hypothetical protein
MDYYMIVWIDPKDASHLGSPEFEDDKLRAKERLRDLKKAHPDRTYALYQCTEIASTDSL